MRAEDEFLAAFETTIRDNGLIIGYRQPMPECWGGGYTYRIDDDQGYHFKLQVDEQRLVRGANGGVHTASYLVARFLEDRRGLIDAAAGVAVSV